MRGVSLGTDEFVQAFSQYGRTLWVLAAAWVGREDAADLVQETARVAWERRGQFVAGTDVRAWLSQIARHVGANWRRRRQPRLVGDNSPEPVAPPPTAAPWPFDVDQHELPDELAHALAGLSEAARACLLLNVITEHTFAEIGEMLGLPANTVASHVRRARDLLRAALAPAAQPEPMTGSP